MAGLVGTQRILTASAERSVHRSALINVNAACGNVARIVCPALLANAVRLCVVGLAVSMCSAIHIAARHFALLVRRRTDKTSRARAPKRAGRIFAYSIRAACGLYITALINIDAFFIGLRFKTVPTETLLLDAFGICTAVRRRPTGAVWRLLWFHLDVNASITRIACLALRTGTLRLAAGRTTEGITSTR